MANHGIPRYTPVCKLLVILITKLFHHNFPRIDSSSESNFSWRAVSLVINNSITGQGLIQLSWKD